MTQAGDEREAWLTLIRAPGLGARIVRQVLDSEGCARDALLRLRRAPASESGIADATRAALLDPDLNAIDSDRHWLDQPGQHLLTWLDADYPALLRDTARPPLALFVRGDPGLLWQPQLAIVGSRNPTAGGRDNALAFATALARSGVVITSGLAGGVDSAAHEGALRGGRTIAVVGTGPDVVYPAGNAALAERIAGSGAIVSEFAPGTPPRPEHFPRRNRLIAGLSLGTLVVEAALRSGSLITARLATEAGREVFALPGSIHNPMARGCHRLIRDGARLVETAGEILEELKPMAARLAERLRDTLAADAAVQDTAGDAGNSAGRLADPDYQRLWDALGHDPQPVDALAERTGLTVADISSMLLIMELDGLITVGANGRYGRAGRKAE
ncbi:DNA-processing protein DprA [Pseudofulvimonas gallinarii]|uniref:DNA processing protein n=1 Tax=Pseudofulvimonas gallinarii TaxID=634155 RepID=A0A4R3L829_9GAMM|nr:DNA-processing protein DprA [Pseudofulvimonas gallinarii]TCS95160.1 DNA processing protein [Pseudofulvimonas gallinarii]THD13043.1 DNA protecting protein DprA [Pseudofulvimonas gallinarii]